MHVAATANIRWFPGWVGKIRVNVVVDGYPNYASAAFARRSLTTEELFSGVNVLMPDERLFTLRQVDLAGADFAAIEDHLDFLEAQLERIPTRKEQARTALGIMFGAAGLAIGWLEVFWRHYL